MPFHSTGLLRVDLRHRAAIRFYLLEGQIVIAPSCICKTLHLHPMKKTFNRSAQLIKPFCRFTPVYASGLGNGGRKYVKRKE